MPEHHSEAATQPSHRVAPAPGAPADPASSDRCGVLRFSFPETVRVGSATLACGDALDALRDLAPSSIGGVLCDPPYSSGGAFRGDRATGSANGKYLNDGSQYPEFTGDSRDQRGYLAWSTLWLSLARRACVSGALCVVFTDWRQLPVTTDAMQAAGWVWRGIVPWDKTERGRPMPGRYRPQAEYAVWGSNGSRPMVGGTALGVVREPVPRVKLHATGKPVRLMRELLRPMAGPILDPFMGSATVGVACAELGLPYIGIEMAPAYFDIACRRLEAAAERGVEA